LFPAVDCDNARAAVGQKPHGRGADDAGRAGDDGDLAIQANSIRHLRRSPVAPVVPDFHGWRVGRTTFIGPTISSAAWPDQ
jgi:hypothetical protein